MAGIAAEGRKWSYVEKFGRIVPRQRGMRHSEIPRYAREIHFARVLAAETIQLLICRPERGGLAGKFLTEFSSEKEGIGGHHARKHGIERSLAFQGIFGRH